MLPRSTVNGPGERAVVWFQGCNLSFRGCCNQSSHAFDRSRNWTMFCKSPSDWVYN
ncbi:MAG: 4Fe-4S cluster-binding domain-containing protein [Bryobacteraceae bacterium]